MWLNKSFSCEWVLLAGSKTSVTQLYDESYDKEPPKSNKFTIGSAINIL
jgi:hypothetical protein